jgi:two-component system, OmpR family, heavy metal sensor histidine kinase CusS
VRRFSLTTTLTGTFGLITLLTFYLAGSYLYDNLRGQLLRVKTNEVAIKAQHLQGFVAGEDSLAALHGHEYRFWGQTSGNTSFVEQIRSGTGQVILSYNPSSLDTDSLPAVATGTAANAEDVRRSRSPSGQDIYGVTVLAHYRDGTSANIVVACSIADILPLLSEYRATIFRTVALAVLIAAALSYVLVYRAIRPLHHISRHANRITVEGLGVRLDDTNVSPELRDLSRSLNDMFGRLERGFKLLSAYTENLAHDLRTPVTNLRGQTEVMLSRPRQVGEYQALLESNLEEYERLSRMIENILFLDRAENTQISLRRVELNLGEQLEHVAEYFEGLAEDNGTSVRVQATGTIEADPVLFRRVISNLLSNALRHTTPGGVIEMTTAIGRDTTDIAVSNPGPDIPAEHLDKIFERFYRVDEARANSSDSTGLGLAIVRSIMELHHGTVSVESSGGMTTFSVHFPARVDKQAVA